MKINKMDLNVEVSRLYFVIHRLSSVISEKLETFKTNIDKSSSPSLSIITDSKKNENIAKKIQSSFFVSLNVNLKVKISIAAIQKLTFSILCDAVCYL
jgi:hypothetical protein